MRTTPCTDATKAARLAKARQFRASAQDLADLHGDADAPGDAEVSLLVLAGIAAADVICCRAMGEHARGEAHDEAVAVLRRADPAAARQLSSLLKRKSKAGYSDRPVSRDDVRKARRAADALLTAATSP